MIKKINIKMSQDELIKYHSKVYKSYCDDLGNIILEIGHKATSLIDAINPKLCALEAHNLSVKTIYDYVFDEKKLSNKKDKIKDTLCFYILVEFQYRKSEENIPMLFDLYQLLGSFQNHKKVEFDKIKTALKNKVFNERKQLKKEFDKEISINRNLNNK